MQPEGHAQTQAAFRAGLWAPVVPEGLTAPDPAEVPRRFAVYRNNVQFGLIRALAARFPTVERLAGPENFAAAARLFAAAHPPENPVLLRWGAVFPGWLAGFPPAAGLPWLADVARLEWLRGLAYHAADHTPADLSALAVPDPSGLRFRLAASVRLYASAHPALAIWAANQPGAEPARIAPGPSHALIARAQDYAVLTLPVSETDHRVLAALASGATLAQAAAAGDPGPALSTLIVHGLIAAIETEPQP